MKEEAQLGKGRYSELTSLQEVLLPGVWELLLKQSHPQSFHIARSGAVEPPAVMLSSFFFVP